MSGRGADVFITAAGVSSPIGDTVEGFFDSIEAAKIGIRHISRFDASRLATRIGGECDLDGIIAKLGTAVVRHPSFGEDIELGHNPKLAFAMNAISHIVSSAGISPRELVPAALYSSAGLEEVDIACLVETAERGSVPEGRHVCRELPPAFVAEFLSGHYGFGLPPATLVSACSSGAQAVGEAFTAIREGALDIAVAGGTDSMLFPFGINAFNSIGALCEDNSVPAKAIRPFDRDRSGTALGEGAAYFLLESSSSVRRSGRRPLAKIIGYGSSMDAYSPVQPDPEGRGAALAMERAIAMAGIRRDSIGYINAHGTGTRHNDSTETLAVKKVFGAHAGKLAMSSSKPHFGHLLSAAGAIELLATVFAFERGMLPPTLNLENPSPECDLDYVPRAPRQASISRAMSSSFGLNGQNAVLIIEKA